MTPARRKSKFPPQAMTILKCFAKQREKQQLKVEIPSPLSGKTECPPNTGLQTPDVIVLHHYENFRGNYSKGLTDVSTCKRKNAAVNCEKTDVTPNTCLQISGAVSTVTKSTRRNLTSSFNECTSPPHPKSAIELFSNQKGSVEKSKNTQHPVINTQNEDCCSDDSNKDFIIGSHYKATTLATLETSNDVSVRCHSSPRDQSAPLFYKSLQYEKPFHTEKSNKRNSFGIQSSPSQYKVKVPEHESTRKSCISPEKKLANCTPIKASKCDSPSESLRYAKERSSTPFLRKSPNVTSPGNHHEDQFSDRSQRFEPVIHHSPNTTNGATTSISTGNGSHTSKTSLVAKIVKHLKLHEDSHSEDLPYYLKNFLTVLESIFTDNYDYALFNEEDCAIVEKFLGLSRTAQKLYVRLFTRQYSWIPTFKMNYQDINPSLEPVLQELQFKGFLDCEDKLTCLKTIVNVMRVSHLKDLCKSLNIKVAPQKGTMIDVILKHCAEQKSVFTGMDITEAVIKEAKKILKRCWRLMDTTRRIFVRILMLYSLTDTNDQHKDEPFQLTTLVQVNMGQLSFPSYEILREVNIFRSRHELVCYERAYLLDCDIASSMEKKNFETAESLCSAAITEFARILSDESLANHHANLPTFLRKFTAGHLYVRCLEQRIELLQKLNRHPEAVEQLQSLLRQKIYCQGHRGQWIERITLNLHKHMDSPLEALRIISWGLKEQSLTDDHHLALHQRAVSISKSKKLRLKSKDLNKLLVIREAALHKIPEIQIVGKKIEKSIPGYKTVFAAPEFSESGNHFEDVILCSVEEFAILHYKHQGFPEGLHGEGSTLISIFGLLFWDIIFGKGIPDAFRSKHQRVPLDLCTSEFYSSRRVAIDARIDLVRCSTITDLIETMSDLWNEHFGQTSIVNWNRYESFLQLQSLVTCIGNKFLAEVCLRFATNYSYYRGGVPDIIVWNPENGKWKMVEVKGPRDHLSNKQLLWLDFVLRNGVDAEVCLVKAVSG